MNTQTAHSKITPAHLRRQALVYIRQSTPHQVQSHPESTARQYALVQRAQHLGWAPKATMSVDEDQGRSGQGTQHRSGFQKLLADISSGRKRNKKVALKRGFEGVRERLVPWHGWRVVHIGCTAWRPVPPLSSSCLALRGALDRDAQQPLCYASRADGPSDGPR